MISGSKSGEVNIYNISRNAKNEVILDLITQFYDHNTEVLILFFIFKDIIIFIIFLFIINNLYIIIFLFFF